MYNLHSTKYIVDMDVNCLLFSFLKSPHSMSTCGSL